MSGMLYNQTVRIDAEVESEGSEHERDTNFVTAHDDVRCTVQQYEARDRDSNGQWQTRTRFRVYLESALAREGDRIVWEDAAGRIWLIVVDSMIDMGGRGLAWRAEGGGVRGRS